MKNLSYLPLLFCLLFLQCASENNAQEQMPHQAETASRITNVTTHIIQPDSLIQYSHLPATAIAWHDATISALESGVVWSIHKDLGDLVKRGESLATLNLEVLEQMAIEAEANLSYQTYNFEHSEKLMKEGSISEQAHQAAEYDYKRALSNAKTLRTRLSYGTIRAPFSGQVAQRFISKGQLVGQGGPTFRLVQIDSIQIQAWVSEAERVDFAVGRQVTLMLDALPNETFTGKIGRMGSVADDNRRVFPIEVHIANPNRRILPGMIGKLRIKRQTHRNAIVVPREAILERETGPVAFVANQTRANLQKVVLGPAEGDRVLVKEGLTFGDLLIVKGNRDIIDGDPIQIQPESQTP